MKTPRYPLFLAGRAKDTGRYRPVLDKYRGDTRAEISVANAEDLEMAVAACAKAAPLMAAFPRFQRRTALLKAADGFQARSEEFAQILCWEVGKTIRDARGEVARLVDTFRLAAYETSREDGSNVALDASERGVGYEGWVRRFPVGPCLFIAPFNFPLNLAAHKIAPAIAAGCPFVLKPASKTPVSSSVLGEVLAECGLPEGAFSIVPCDRKEADALVSDPRFRLLSFTGSSQVGWEMRQKAGTKKVILELGGNAACLIDESANIAKAIDQLAIGIFAQSGQSCISVQRVYAHRAVYEKLRDGLIERVKTIVVGDPADEKTVVGPLIDEKDAERVEAWVAEAKKAGAKILCGGTRTGAVFAPTLVENAPKDSKLVCEEAFGPLAVLAPIDSFEEGLRQINESRFGLQAGVFTASLENMFHAWETLDVGGVVINEVPTWRMDLMPYGGVKESGLGREGVRSAIEEMTEPRLLVVKRS